MQLPTVRHEGRFVAFGSSIPELCAAAAMGPLPHGACRGRREDQDLASGAVLSAVLAEGDGDGGAPVEGDLVS